jgi:hypothetical protein
MKIKRCCEVCAYIYMFVVYISLCDDQVNATCLFVYSFLDVFGALFNGVVFYYTFTHFSSCLRLRNPQPQ